MRSNLFTFKVLFCLLLSAGAKAQIISSVAGNGVAGYSGDGGLATFARLNSPYSVAVDLSGNMYIADKGNNRIRKVSTSGVISTLAGTGVAAYSGDGGLSILAEVQPLGVAVDGAGNLYFADKTNRVRKISALGVIYNIAGNGTPGYGGDGGAATAAMLNNPVGVAVDGSGNVYVADRDNRRVRKIATTGIITTVAGNGINGYSGDGGAATAAQLSMTAFVAVDGFGNLYLSDQANKCIRKVTTSGIISTVAGGASATTAGDGGMATATLLSAPMGVATDPLGNIYFADQTDRRIRKVNVAGIISTLAGSGIFGYSGDGGPAAAATFNQPLGVAVSSIGDVYISDVINVIRKVTIPVIIPVPSFVSSYNTICESGCVTFTNTSTGVPDSIRWSVPGMTLASPHANVINICFPSSEEDTVSLRYDTVSLYTYKNGSVDTAISVITIKSNPHPVFTLTDNTFTVAGTYDAYQWYIGSIPIGGARSNTYTFSVPGVYKVVVDSNGCPGTSLAYSTVGVKQTGLADHSITVCPNPNSGVLTVQGMLNKTGSDKVQLEISNMLGQVVYRELTATKNGALQQQIVLNDGLASGVYILRVTYATGKSAIRFTIER
jgi:hypothetical protein